MNLPEFSDQPGSSEPGSVQPVEPSGSAADGWRIPASRQTDVNGPMIHGRFALLLVLIMVVLADLTVYQAHGFMGPAVFFVAASVLLFIGIPGRSVRFCSLLMFGLLVLLSVRLGWNGSYLQVVAGIWLLSAWAVALHGQTPFFLDILMFATQSIPGGYDFYSRINNRVRERVLGPVDQRSSFRFLDVALPIISLLLFGGVFVMANPDVVNWMYGSLGSIVDAIRHFLFQFSVFEIVFWCGVAWLTGGFLRPLIGSVAETAVGFDLSVDGGETALYSAFRNTLLTVIALFGVYLLFESRAFFSRKPPQGFTYSSYAHEGAAWLTVALGLATLMLSLIFRGLTLCDSRVRRLQKLAWIWSALNFALAIAVYNRMLMYIDYNGMTRMRTIALLGITSVVGGFALVLFKIHWKQSFHWLIRRQLWVLCLAMYVYIVLPVDVLIHKYNVRQILNGNPAPVVQVTAHPVDDEALPVLLPLCAADDQRIREGVKGLLAIRFDAVETELKENESHGWTAWQKGLAVSRTSLQESRSNWDEFSDRQNAAAAWMSLQSYAFRTWW